MSLYLWRCRAVTSAEAKRRRSCLRSVCRSDGLSRNLVNNFAATQAISQSHSNLDSCGLSICIRPQAVCSLSVHPNGTLRWVCVERGRQEPMIGSVLCLSSDESWFYVGYSFSGVVEKYTVATGALVCSALSHYGDVHTMAVLQPDVLCTSGSDGRVRLLDLTSNDSLVQTSTFKPTASSLSPDELAYQQISTGLLSIQLVGPQNNLSPFQMVACSSSGGPHLIELQNSLHVQSLGLLASDNIGNYVPAVIE